MKRAGSCLLFVSLVCLSFQALAKVNVEATVDRNQVAVGETFILQVSVSSDQAVPVNQPSLPVIENAQLRHSSVSSQSKSSVVSSGQGVQFKTIKTKIFSYQFLATAKGKIIVEPIVVAVDEDVYQTAPISMEVLSQGSVPPKAQAQRGAPPNQWRQPQPPFPKDPIDELEERFNQLLNRQFGGAPNVGGFMTEPRNAEEAFFILAEVDKTEAYKGEQITAAWYLYTQGRVRDIDTLMYPSLTGFWKEDIQI